jgi:hypothetical protein
MKSNQKRIGNFIVLDLGTHKVFGCKAVLTSRVGAVGLPSEKQDLLGSQREEPQNLLRECRSDDTHVQPYSLDRSL